MLIIFMQHNHIDRKFLNGFLLIIRFNKRFKQSNWEQSLFKIPMVFPNSRKQLENKMYNCHNNIKIIS